MLYALNSNYKLIYLIIILSKIMKPARGPQTVFLSNQSKQSKKSSKASKARKPSKQAKEASKASKPSKQAKEAS